MWLLFLVQLKIYLESNLKKEFRRQKIKQNIYRSIKKQNKKAYKIYIKENTIRKKTKEKKNRKQYIQCK